MSATTKQWLQPRRFDRNLIVIGAGAAGLVSAYIAAATRAKVTLIEAKTMGGDCLNTGCVPSKALIHAARQVTNARRAQALGINIGTIAIDFPAVMDSVQHAVNQVAPHDSIRRYRELGVDVRLGHAQIVSPWQVEIDGQVLSTRAIVIAAGAEPFIPPIPGLIEVGYLTSDTVWRLREKPRRMLVLGGGPIGCELAQAFARLGVSVTQVEMAERLLLREDDEVSEFVAERLREDGVDVRTSHKAIAVEQYGADGDENVPYGEDHLLIWAARRAGLPLRPLGAPLQTSARKYSRHGWLATTCKHWHLTAAQAWPEWRRNR